MSVSINLQSVQTVKVDKRDPEYSRPYATVTVKDSTGFGGASVTLFFADYYDSDISSVEAARAMRDALTEVVAFLDPAPEPEPQDEPADYWMHQPDYV